MWGGPRRIPSLLSHFFPSLSPPQTRIVTDHWFLPRPPSLCSWERGPIGTSPGRGYRSQLEKAGGLGWSCVWHAELWKVCSVPGLCWADSLGVPCCHSSFAPPFPSHSFIPSLLLQPSSSSAAHRLIHSSSPVSTYFLMHSEGILCSKCPAGADLAWGL